VPEDATYCPYCAYGLKPYALTGKVSAAGALMVTTGCAFFVVFVISLSALLQIYSWYPPLIAQKWFRYDVAFMGFCLCGFLLAIFSSALIFARKFYLATMILTVASTVMGAGVWVTSMITPESNLMYSILYYFLAMLLSPLIASLLVLPRKQEFQQRSAQQMI